MNITTTLTTILPLINTTNPTPKDIFKDILKEFKDSSQDLLSKITLHENHVKKNLEQRIKKNEELHKTINKLEIEIRNLEKEKEFLRGFIYADNTGTVSSFKMSIESELVDIQRKLKEIKNKPNITGNITGIETITTVIKELEGKKGEYEKEATNLESKNKIIQEFVNREENNCKLSRNIFKTRDDIKIKGELEDSKKEYERIRGEMRKHLEEIEGLKKEEERIIKNKGDTVEKIKNYEEFLKNKGSVEEKIKELKKEGELDWENIERLIDIRSNAIEDKPSAGTVLELIKSKYETLKKKEESLKIEDVKDLKRLHEVNLMRLKLLEEMAEVEKEMKAEGEKLINEEVFYSVLFSIGSIGFFGLTFL